MAKKSIEPSKESRLSFFDLMSAINAKTKIEWDEETEKVMVPYMVNKGYAQFQDTTFLAAEMNKYPDLDRKMVYDFYYHMVPKKSRYGKWDKADKIAKDEELVMQYYGVSRDKTSSYIRTLDVVNPQWREQIAEKVEKGGRKR